ncbi:hypothetical protein [Pedobacter metabolipauper]|uniref:Uncharacterized protein n=1 Tax=Pedobacter metabolipauper TaxID=425513 RepID=A0A4R6T3L7_9SPHI|nr:hypothetical protein [Pedobacter metabolipauper]TDQ12130.1 hypothetical protein ATK78_1261 [Pedobacter metabolipauper]
MIKNLLLFLFVSCSLSAAAIQTDTSAYQTQRLKVNALLSERSQKFGQYDQSLSTRTGIFGLQTKKDVENSNEILRQIVLNDNNIFKELKILMEYKDQQVKAVQEEANSVNSRAQNYMNAIKKLQDENQTLRNETGKKENFSYYVIAFLVLVLAGSTYFFLKKLKEQGLTR